MFFIKKIFHFEGQSIGWGFLALNLSQISQFLTSLIVAPYLQPKDLGIIALGSGIVLFFENIRDLGMQEALLRQKILNKNFINTIGFILFINGILLTLLLYYQSSFWSYFLKTPELKEALPFIALSLPLEGFNRIPIVILLHSRSFKRLFFLQLIPILFSAPVTFVLAFNHLGYWSLIYGGLFASILRTFIMSLIWRPYLKFEFRGLSSTLSFGLHVFWQFFLAWLNMNVLRFLIARFLGSSVLGLLGFSMNIVLKPINLFFLPWTKLAFIHFSKLQDQPFKLQNTFWKYWKTGLLISFIMAIILGVLIPLSVSEIFGPQWKETAPLIPVFAIIAVLQAFGGLTGELLKSLGKPQVYSRFLTVRILCNLALYIWSIPKGLHFFLLAFLIMDTIFSQISFFLALFSLKAAVKKGYRAL